MNILITGGNGYIGAVVSNKLINEGDNVLIIDKDTSRGEKFRKLGAKVIELDLNTDHETDHLCKLIESTGFIPELILHFAAYKSVPESVNNPWRYYRNNLSVTLNVIYIARRFGAKIIHSSSCAVYGITNTFLTYQKLEPAASPYASTKQMDEIMLRDCCKAYDLTAISLRYFNPIGVSEDDPDLGPKLNVPTECKNVVSIMSQCADRGIPFTVFGNDYDTPDGSCVRDYIDINDLADAHISAISQLSSINGWTAFNVGTEVGTSVIELCEDFKKIDPNFKYVIGPRREGDVPMAVASDELLPGFKCTRKIGESLRSEYAYLKSHK